VLGELTDGSHVRFAGALGQSGELEVLNDRWFIALQESDFPTERRELRKVQKDGYVPVDGSLYPVRSHLVGQFLTVRIYPSRVEILDSAGQAASVHAIPTQPRRLPAPPEARSRSEQTASTTAIETRFLARFPGAAEFLVGLKRSMSALLPIHLRGHRRSTDRPSHDLARLGQAVPRAPRDPRLAAGRRVGRRTALSSSAASSSTTPSGPAGMVLAVEFTLAGTKFSGLNGGPQFPFTEAVSFQIACEDQAEVDRLWAALADGGSPGQCGWLKDRWGLSWQIVPRRLFELLADADADRSRRAMQAMLTMTKLNIAELERAADSA
jgi:predicted 3-demethylubiquinone-9 3-methyltransferase (glyoxalase superfamily)